MSLMPSVSVWLPDGDSRQAKWRRLSVTPEGYVRVRVSYREAWRLLRAGRASLLRPILTSQQRLALRFLSRHPNGLYGLDLIKASFHRISRFSVYVTLARLEDKGLVERSHPPDDHPGLPRPTFRLTERGRAVARQLETQ